jgi:hypothetical protein
MKHIYHSPQAEGNAAAVAETDEQIEDGIAPGTK